MKDVTAKLSNLQIAPRKVRLVAGLIRGVSVDEARKRLVYNPKRAARPVLKLLNSAAANAENNFKMNPESLKVKAVTVGHGRTLKRYKPRAFGRATMLRKRASHVEIVIEGEEGKAAAQKESAKKREVKNLTPDQEKAEPKKKQGKAAASHKPEPVDPRRMGHEKKNQHVDKTVKEKPSVQKKNITRTHNK